MASDQLQPVSVMHGRRDDRGGEVVGGQPVKLLGYAMDAALAVVLLGLMCAFAGVDALTGGGR